jgi:hypothetical protein
MDVMSAKKATVYALTRPLTSGGHARLLNRTTLDLVKALRSGGVEVAIEPNDGSPIHYYIRKGGVSLLADPTFAFIIGIPVSVLTGLIANWLFARLSSKDRVSQEQPSIVFRAETPHGSVFYSHTGTTVSEAEAERVVDLLRTSAEDLTTLGAARHSRGRYPVCLEHSTTIVGWADLWPDEIGLRAHATITDDAVMQRIRSGEIRGLSIAGIVSASRCSICGHDYTDCIHISGLEYEGQICTNTVTRAVVTELSIVSDPTNPDCVIEMDVERGA